MPPEEEPYDETKKDIKVGDFIKLKNRNLALHNGLHKFLNTDHQIGDKMGKVEEIRIIDDFECVKSSRNSRFYKMDCVELDEEWY